MQVLYFSPLGGDTDEWRQLLCAALPSLRFDALAPGHAPTKDQMRGTEVLLAFRPPHGLAAQLPRLRAIQSLAVGVDHLLGDPTLPSVPIAKMIDPQVTRMMLEYVLCAVLRHHRAFDRHELHTREGVWRHVRPKVASQTCVGFLGAGDLARAAAEPLLRLGFEICMWSRSGHPVPGVDVLQGEAGLLCLQSRADIVVVMLPGTPETAGLVDAAFLAKLKRGASLVNVGRGQHVVPAALLAALQEGQLGAATLDVFDEEPLKPDSPLWREPRLLITPHVGSYSTPQSAAPHVIQNLRRLGAGQPLLGEVSRNRGY